MRTRAYYQEKYNTLKLYYDAKVHIRKKFSGETLQKLESNPEYFPNTFSVVKPPDASQIENPKFTAHLRLFMARNCHPQTDWGHLKEQAAQLVGDILSETNYNRITNCEQTIRKSKTKKQKKPTSISFIF